MSRLLNKSPNRPPRPGYRGHPRQPCKCHHRVWSRKSNFPRSCCWYVRVTCNAAAHFVGRDPRGAVCDNLVSTKCNSMSLPCAHDCRGMCFGGVDHHRANMQCLVNFAPLVQPASAFEFDWIRIKSSCTSANAVMSAPPCITLMNFESVASGRRRLAVFGVSAHR